MSSVLFQEVEALEVLGSGLSVTRSPLPDEREEEEEEEDEEQKENEYDSVSGCSYPDVIGLRSRFLPSLPQRPSGAV